MKKSNTSTTITICTGRDPDKPYLELFSAGKFHTQCISAK